MSQLISVFRVAAVLSILASLMIYLEIWDVGQFVAAAQGYAQQVMQGLVIAAILLFIAAAYFEEQKKKTEK